MDLALWKADGTYKAFAGNQWASLDNLCRINAAQSFYRNALYQNFVLQSTHSYLLRFSVRTTSQVKPNSILDLQYAHLSQLTAIVSNTEWNRFDVLLTGNNISSALSFANKDLNNPVDIDDIWLIDLGTPDQIFIK
ncbi:MAG: hypothetical protein EOP10_32920 [Proteobacteria bacterium]|nr:MAG: hypothetical protein EOP10_32920 [Pseudomonadota bacterium]